MAGPRRALVLLGLLAVVLASCGGGSDPKPLNTANAVVRIRARAIHALDDESVVGRVRCPAKVDRARGVTFACTVEIDGAPLRVVVRQIDDNSHVHIALAQTVLLTDKVEHLIADYASKNDQVVRDVNCGPTTYLIRAPGKKVTCEVTLPDGNKVPAVIGVKNLTGDTALISFGPTKG